MARLIPLLVLIVLIAVVVVAWRSARPRSDRVYRPRGNPFGRAAGAGASDANWVVRAAELEGLRDAYSSESLDPARKLYRCGGCQAWYHEGSVRSLDLDNGGRCALCGSLDLKEVRVL